MMPFIQQKQTVGNECTGDPGGLVSLAPGTSTVREMTMD